MKEMKAIIGEYELLLLPVDNLPCVSVYAMLIKLCLRCPLRCMSLESSQFQPMHSYAWRGFVCPTSPFIIAAAGTTVNVFFKLCAYTFSQGS